MSESTSPSTCRYVSACLTGMACSLPLPGVVERTARRAPAVAGPGLVPLDDATGPPDMRTADRLVGRRHLAPCPVGAHGPDRHPEVGGDIAARPPLGLRIWRVHPADGSARPTPFGIYALNALPFAQLLRTL